MMNARTKRRLLLLAKYVIVLFFILVFFLPIISMFLVSLKSEAEIFDYSTGIWPQNPKWSNYVFALTSINYLRYLYNTVIVSVFYTISCTFSSAMAGYAFARFQIRETNFFFTIVLSSIMIPYIITIIPFYLLVRSLALTDKHFLWLIYGISGAPFMIYLFRQFFLTIPASFEESARIDGANRWQIFFRIMLPLVKSGTVIAAMFAFQWTWQDYIMPVLFLTAKTTTLAVKLNGAYVDVQQNILYGPLMAGVFYYIAVPVILFFIFKRQIMEGMLTGGLKG